jgi:hypothetical protein
MSIKALIAQAREDQQRQMQQDRPQDSQTPDASLLAKNCHLLHLQGEQLVQAIEKLLPLLVEETQAVRQRQFHDVAKLQDAKRQAVGGYEQAAVAFKGLAAHAAQAMAKLEQSFKAHLQGVYARLEAAIIDNALALKAAKETSERILNMVQSVARDQTPTGSGYNARGELHNGYGRMRPAPALTLNGRF